jgi:hypothetical protein
VHTNRRLLIAMLRRSARLWLLTRLALSAVLLFAGDDPLRLPLSVNAVVVVFCVTAGFLDVQRHHERDLFANLGVRRRDLLPWLLLPVLLGECALVLLRSRA